MSNNYKDYLQHYGVRGMKWDKVKVTKPLPGNQSNDQTQANVMKVTGGPNKPSAQELRDSAKKADAQVNANLDSPPKEYKPQMTPKTSLSGKEGFIDQYGMFYEGDYETARKNKYKKDLWLNQMKLDQAKKDKQYENSAQKKIDDVGKDIHTALTKVSKLSKKTVDNGKKFFDNLFKKK